MTIFDPRKNVLRIDEKFFPAFLCGMQTFPRLHGICTHGCTG